MKSIASFVTLTWLLTLFFAPALAEDWRRFRGPNGGGSSSDTNLPVHWSDRENVAWKIDLPGLGSSSPITLGDRIYLTCYSGYGLVPNEGDQANLMRHLVCLNRKSGKILWQKPFSPQLPESDYAGGNDSWHGYSSSTPATDGERLYVFFGKSGVYCLNLDGEPIWHADVGDGTDGWGSANSPILHKNLVLINASVESGSLVALNKMTGERIWRASGMRASWNTPCVIELDNGSGEVAVSIQRKVLAFDVHTGEELWNCDGIPTYVCPSILVHDGILYASGGRGKQFVMAIRPGGRGDVTDTHRLWIANKGSNVSSPVYHNGFLYCANDSRGIVFCIDAKTGEVVYQERLDPRPDRIYASAVLGDGKIYYTSRHEGIYVIAAKPEFELLAHNTLGADTSRTNAGLVVSDGDLLIRNDQRLYCISNK